MDNMFPLFKKKIKGERKKKNLEKFGKESQFL